MPRDEEVAQLTLQLAVPNADADELDRATRQLRDEIREVGVKSVELTKGTPVPAGAKSAEVVTLGVLAVAVLPTTVPKLIEFLRDWLMRGEGRTVKIKTQMGDRALEVEYNPQKMSQAELKELIGTLTSAMAGKPG